MGVYKDAVQSYLKIIGFSLRQQCDPDMPCTIFPSGYLPSAQDDDNNTTGRKIAHNMRGMLLVILLFMSSDFIITEVGADMLSNLFIYSN